MAETLAADLVPQPKPNAAQTPLLRRIWEAVQLPALALFSAFVVGGFIIALTDLEVLAALVDTINRLNTIGYLLLAVTAVVLVVGITISRRPEVILARLGFAATGRQSRWFNIIAAILTTLAVIGLLIAIGFGPVLALGWQAVMDAYGALLEGSLGSPATMLAALQSGEPKRIAQAFYPISEALVTSTPYIFAGLAVALGFRSGLFNIGVEGQLFIGAITSVFVGYSLQGLPAIIHIPLTLAAGALGGAAWGFIPAS